MEIISSAPQVSSPVTNMIYLNTGLNKHIVLGEALDVIVAVNFTSGVNYIVLK